MKKNKPFGELLYHSLKKTLLTMRIAVILMILGIMQARANEAYSQKTRLSVNFSETELGKILDKIEVESEFFFIYNEKLLDVDRKVSISEKDQLINAILDDLFAGTNVKYTIIDRKIILAPDYLSEVVSQQKNQVSGTVTDKNGPIPGVNIVVTGTTTGAITDLNGKYTITIPPDAKSLTFTFIGMNPQEINIGNLTKIDVTMAESAIGLDEIVVVGYGTQNRKTLTGAISSVQAKDLNTVNAVSVDNMLQGKAAGVAVTQHSSQPGSGSDVVIRGALSVNGDNSPLYVIDGVAITKSPNLNGIGRGWDTGDKNGLDLSPLSTINPADIESIDVLKDASATAIYGSAAANGVILITTKKGKSGRPTLTYDVTYSVQKLNNYWEPLNSQDFMNYANVAKREDWLYNGNYAPYGPNIPNAANAPVLFTQDEIKNAKSYNHVNEVMRTGHIIDQNFSITGGNEKSKYFVSLNYYRNVPVLDFCDWTRYTGRVNFDQQLTSWLKFNMSSSYTKWNINNPSSGSQSTYGGQDAQVGGSAIFFPPNVPLWKAPGKLNQSYDGRTSNPLIYLYRKDKNNINRLFLAPSLEVKIYNDLKANIVTGYDESSTVTDIYNPGVGGRAYGFDSTRMNNYGRNDYNNTINSSLESYLTYSKTFNTIHKLSVVAGGGYYKTISSNFYLEAYEFPNDMEENYDYAANTNSTLFNHGSNKVEHTKKSQFGRLNYTLMDRYIIGLTARRDGSTSFPENNKYGFFPGISGGWIISEENFLKNNLVVSNLKLRGGWGTAGNESGLNNNSYYVTTYSAFAGPLIGGKPVAAVELNNIENPNLKWETDITENIGLDFSLLKDRVSGSFDVYRRTAKDQLGWSPGNSTDPVGGLWKNMGSTQSQGYELSLRCIVIKTSDFEWNVNSTFSHNHSYWLERNFERKLYRWEGQHDDLGAIYGWKTDGLFHSIDEVNNYKGSTGNPLQPLAVPGNIKYVDVNNDGKLDTADIVNLGSRAPKYNFGLSTSLRFKNWDLNISTYGSLLMKTTDGNGAFAQFSSLLSKSNQTKYVKEVWTSDNPNGTRPGIARDYTADNNPIIDNPNNDFGLQSTNFWRLKNITLGYTLPKSLLNKFNISNIRLYCDAENLAVWTNYKGLDPEVERGNTSAFPISLIIAFGLNVTF